MFLAYVLMVIFLKKTSSVTNVRRKKRRMKYQELRDKAIDGDIIFLTVDRKNILSRITSFFTKSPYTHTAFVFWYNERLLVAESTTHGGSRIATASQYADREFALVDGPKHWLEISDKALERSGTAEYGWWSAIYIGIREFLFTHFNVKLPQNKSNRNKACSEYVAEIIGLDDTDISPGALYKLLTAG